MLATWDLLLAVVGIGAGSYFLWQSVHPPSEERLERMRKQPLAPSSKRGFRWFGIFGLVAGLYFVVQFVLVVRR